MSLEEEEELEVLRQKMKEPSKWLNRLADALKRLAGKAVEALSAVVESVELMNCFCGMVDRRKALSLISSRDHCQRSSPSRISDTPRAGFEPAQNLSSGLVE